MPVANFTPSVSSSGTSAVFLAGTAGTIRVGDIPGSMGVYFSPAVPTIDKARSASGLTGAVELITTARQIIAANTSRKSIIFVHDASNTVYIGLSSALTTGSLGNGFPLVANQIASFDDYTGAVFGALDTGNVKIKYIEM